MKKLAFLVGALCFTAMGSFAQSSTGKLNEKPKSVKEISKTPVRVEIKTNKATETQKSSSAIKTTVARKEAKVAEQPQKK